LRGFEGTYVRRHLHRYWDTTIAHAVTCLHPGDALRLLTGTYYEHVKLQGLGQPGGPSIVISAAAGHRATIDGAQRFFIDHPDKAWAPVPPGIEATPMQVVEYKSCSPLPHGADRGAFTTGRASFTKLISYDRQEDFLAVNQLFGKLPQGVEDPPGPMVSAGTRHADLFPRRPWVYMGPGLWQDEKGYLHIRLSHTTLGVPEGEDYTGETDPRQLPLAIWGGDDDECPGGNECPALEIRECHCIKVCNLTVQHAREAVVVAKSTGVSLDHMIVNAGGYGVHIGDDCGGTRITNTVVDGGMAPWFFRSDRKGDYHLADDSPNVLAGHTVNLLIASDKTAHGTWIEQCEFVNGHDLLLNGAGVTFTKNWIRNLNDDGIFIGEIATNMRIVGNVIEQCLMAVTILPTLMWAMSMCTATSSTCGFRRLGSDLTPIRSWWRSCWRTLTTWQSWRCSATETC
jgi:hypothetical protein